MFLEVPSKHVLPPYWQNCLYPQPYMATRELEIRAAMIIFSKWFSKRALQTNSISMPHSRPIESEPPRVGTVMCVCVCVCVCVIEVWLI